MVDGASLYVRTWPGEKSMSVAGSFDHTSRTSAVILPIDAEMDAMSAALPSHGVVQLEAPAWVECGGGRPNGQAGGGNRNRRCSDTDASPAVLLFRGELLVTDKEIGIAEIIHQIWAQGAGHTQQALIRPSHFTDPIGRICVSDGVCGSADRARNSGCHRVSSGRIRCGGWKPGRPTES